MKDKRLLIIGLLFILLSGVLAAGICLANEYDSFDPFNETEDFLSVPDPPAKASWWYSWMTPVVPYDTAEKVLLGTLVTTNAADAATTISALEKGAVEMNPLLGDSPSTSAIIATKVLFVSVMVVCANNLNHTSRKVALGTLSLLFGAVSLHNISVINDID